MDIKDVAKYWDKEPCNTCRGRPYGVGTKEFFDEVERIRYASEPTIPIFAEFDKYRGKKVLEVGCGLGTELTQFARAGAIATGIDISINSVSMTNKRLNIYGLDGIACHMNAEAMRFDDNTYDLVYSWGVIHHSSNPEKVIDEIYRVLKPNGVFKGMMYKRVSTMGFAVWAKDVLRHKNPFVSLKTTFARSMESPGTKAYSIDELKDMFRKFKKLRLEYDNCAEYMALYKRNLQFILKVYPKQLLSWVRIKGIK